ncbi:MAG: glycosyltransferase family 39 protein, partial [Chloroflexi bacterium]|nr:glycosyltransferase family 39 protein [Chloroflexota bacterium]
GVLLGAFATLCSVAATLISTRDEFSPVANYLWLVALPLLLTAALVHDRVGAAHVRALFANMRRQAVLSELLAVALITLIAFVLRAYDLAHYPPTMHGDEGEMGMMALRVLDGKYPLALFGTFWLDHPSLFHYIQAMALVVFGRDEPGLRLLSALFGTACVPLTFAIARLGWGRLAGFSAAWLTCASALHIQYSRIGLNNIESVFSMTLVVLLLALMHERGAARLHVATGDIQRDSANATQPTRALLLPVLAGLMIGFSQYLYYGSRLIPIVAAPVLLYLWRERALSHRQIGVGLLATAVAFLPLGVFYLNHPPAFFNRMSGVSILREQNVKQLLGDSATLPRDALALIRVQLERNLNFFVRGGDASSFYLQDIPAFDVLTALLFWLGLGVALTRVRRYHEFAVVT